MTSRPVRRRPLVLAVLGVALLAGLVFSTIRVRTDLGGFVPDGDTPASRLMRAEIESGAAARLVLGAIEGAAPADLARVSDAVAKAARASGEFGFVANGRDLLTEAGRAWLFRYRYLLSPAITPDSFSAAALRRDVARLFRGLQGSAAPLLEEYGFADPPGSFLALLETLAEDGPVRTRDGVWFNAAGDRALLVARLNAGGIDAAAEDRGIAVLRAAFAAANPGSARLELAGPAVLAAETAHVVRGDVERLSIVSSLLAAALLVWRFRSPWILAAMAVPVGIGLCAAAAVTGFVFGYVHGIALGFGMTMLGVTLDYPVLLIGHRKSGEAARGTFRRIGGAFTLSALAAALGLTGMVFSNFPGLSQLGLFSAAGVLGAAVATRFLLPPLIVAADLAPVSAGDPARLRRIERWREKRLWALPFLAAAAAVIALDGPLDGPLAAAHDPAALSPVPPEALARDARIRADLGAPGTGPLLVVRDVSAEAVLRREEDLMPRIDALVRQGVMAGASAASRVLPSAATQAARRDALPSRDVLAPRVVAAAAGLPFEDGAFEPFLAGVEASRALAPATPANSGGSALAERIAAQLFERDGAWFGIIAPHGMTDVARARTDLPDGPNLTWLDMKAEADRLQDAAARQAWHWFAGGALAAFAALAITLRDPARLLRIAAAVAGALLITGAGLSLTGTVPALPHIVSLQLVTGLALDYALFFSRPRLDEEERARTVRTLITCNGLSLLTFGLLLTCRTPLLRDIGLTVTMGVPAAMLLAFLFAGPRPGATGETPCAR